jgi:hypothetical protein
MTRLRRHSALATVVATVTALVLAGAAVAYWTTTGSGSASAATRTVLAVTLTAGIPSAELYPGGAADVATTVSNPNAFAVRLGSLSLDTSQGTGGFGVDGGHAGCDLSTLGFTTQSSGGAGWTIPPKVGAANGELALDLPDAVAMGATAANACQGASFVVHLVVGA